MNQRRKVSASLRVQELQNQEDSRSLEDLTKILRLLYVFM